MDVIVASGDDGVHRKTMDKPAAKSKPTELQLGAVPGVWTVIDRSLAIGHARLNHEEWATAHPKLTQRIAPQITGPKYFSPRLVDATNVPEHDHGHTHVMSPAGGCAAKNTTNRSPTRMGRQLDDWQTVNGIDATSRVANNACPLVLSSILGSQCGGQRPREDRLERCCLVRRWQLKYAATAPAKNTSKTTSTTVEELGRMERKVHMDCKPAGPTTGHRQLQQRTS